MLPPPPSPPAGPSRRKEKKHTGRFKRVKKFVSIQAHQMRPLCHSGVLDSQVARTLFAIGHLPDCSSFSPLCIQPPLTTQRIMTNACSIGCIALDDGVPKLLQDRNQGTTGLNTA